MVWYCSLHRVVVAQKDGKPQYSLPSRDAQLGVEGFTMGALYVVFSGS